METLTASDKPSGLTPILHILNTYANVFPGKLAVYCKQYWLLSFPYAVINTCFCIINIVIIIEGNIGADESTFPSALCEELRCVSVKTVHLIKEPLQEWKKNWRK